MQNLLWRKTGVRKARALTVDISQIKRLNMYGELCIISEI